MIIVKKNLKVVEIEYGNGLAEAIKIVVKNTQGGKGTRGRKMSG